MTIIFGTPGVAPFPLLFHVADEVVLPPSKLCVVSTWTKKSHSPVEADHAAKVLNRCPIRGGTTNRD